MYLVLYALHVGAVYLHKVPIIGLGEGYLNKLQAYIVKCLCGIITPQYFDIAARFLSLS